MFQRELKKRYKYHFINFEVNTHCSYRPRPPPPTLIFEWGDWKFGKFWKLGRKGDKLKKKSSRQKGKGERKYKTCRGDEIYIEMYVYRDERRCIKVNTKVCTVTTKPSQSSRRHISPFKGLSALLNNWVVNFTKVKSF